MDREEAFRNAETKAAHKAGEVFMETLRDELRKIGGVSTVMEALGTTEHIHYAIVLGEKKGVVRYTFLFDDSPATVTAVEKFTQRGPGTISKA